jgi:hypothetical protein
MSDVIRLMPADDRKALEVTHDMLGYVQREIGELKTPQPELAAAIARALQVSEAILSAGQRLASPRERARRD